MGENISNPPAKQASATTTARQWWFILLAVFVSSVAIIVEFTSGILAGVYFDPMPTWVHLFVLALVPVSFVYAEWSLGKKPAPMGPWWIAFAFMGNAFALTVSSLYLIVYLPIMPLAIMGILMMGLGILGLSPLFCTVGGIMQMRRLYSSRDFFAVERGWALKRTLLGCFLAVLLLGGMEVRPFVISYAIGEACSETADQRAEGIWLLKTLGGEEEVLSRCYGRHGRNAWILNARGNFNSLPSELEPYRLLYFRLTGKPYNSVPRPPSENVLLFRRGWEDWEEQQLNNSEIGGDAVAGRVKGVGLFSSAMDAKLESHTNAAGPGLAYLEWILEFRNSTGMQQEARAQIIVPPDAVASRLTLWIGGEEREAAFGGRLQVKQAYQDVAVVRRRDPALLSTMGHDRLLFQCFPIPPGGKMKAKIGITVPLYVRSDRAYLRLPYFAERNFAIPSGFSHNIWVEGNAQIESGSKNLLAENPGKERYAVRGKLLEKELLDPASGVISLPFPASGKLTFYKARLGKAETHMTWKAPPAEPPQTVCIVLDGSCSMAKADFKWKTFCESLPASCKLNAIFATHTTVKWKNTPVPASPDNIRQLADWLSNKTFYGGCDPVPALEEAWDMASTGETGLILWIHGPLPVSLSSPEGLVQRYRRRPASEQSGVRLLSLAVMPGPNRVEELLGDPMGVVRLPVLESCEKTLAYVGKNLRGQDVSRTYQLALGGETIKNTQGQAVTTSDQLVRLAVYEKVREFCRSGEKEDLKRATRLAVSTRLVTPVSGAVVLERKEQYDRHDLDPDAEVEPESIPGIPEPEEWALIIIALIFFVVLIHKRRVRLA